VSATLATCEAARRWRAEQARSDVPVQVGCRDDSGASGFRVAAPAHRLSLALGEVEVDHLVLDVGDVRAGTYSLPGRPDREAVM